jgi:hypothetical protein
MLSRGWIHRMVIASGSIFNHTHAREVSLNGGE